MNDEPKRSPNHGRAADWKERQRHAPKMKWLSNGEPDYLGMYPPNEPRPWMHALLPRDGGE